MTEDDAKTKWCPMGRAGSVAEAAIPQIRSGGYNCIGSACMWGCDSAGAWRGNCGLTPTPPAVENGPMIPTRILRGAMGDPIGKGVYNNPQPGDPDHPETPKTDISSGG